ncbi:MAG: NUDIX domain-containing protein [Polyangiaceae bacterium]|nr:NUDIX domain-containing protein [Polyangiaceae bacterium]
MLELLEAAGELAFHRGAFSPGHFTASAFVVGPGEDELLLILHAKLGRWLQPGGHVDAEDATLLAAARRELAEETGLAEVDVLSEAPFDLDVHRIPAGRAPAHLHFDVRYLFRARARALRAATDAADARWVPLAEVASLERDASVLRAVAALERARASR